MTIVLTDDDIAVGDAVSTQLEKMWGWYLVGRDHLHDLRLLRDQLPARQRVRHHLPGQRVLHRRRALRDHRRRPDGPAALAAPRLRRDLDRRGHRRASCGPTSRSSSSPCSSGGRSWCWASSTSSSRIRYHYLPYWWAYLIRGIIAVAIGLPLHPPPRRAADRAGRPDRHPGHRVRRRRDHRRLLGPPRHQALGGLQGAAALSAGGASGAAGQLLPAGRAVRARASIARGRGRRPERPRHRVAGDHGRAAGARSCRRWSVRRRAAAAGGARRHALGAVRRHAPVPDPPAILAIGMNYRAHVAEMGREPPEWQYWFNKQRTAIAGPGDPIVLPSVSDMVDYEGELAMVIGPPLPARARGPGARGGGRLHHHQRRQRARLAVADTHLHHGQVVRHPRPVRPRAGDRGRAGRPRRRWPSAPGSTTSSARTRRRPT